MFIMVSYDIKSNKIRRKIKKVIESFGKRVQYSVFECFLSGTQFNEMKNKIQETIKDKPVSIRFYILCDMCNKKIEFYGCGKILDDDQYYMV
ncbi:CRISPR-associated endonuclease Cas2 [Candidatus Desantisbacteria bacterium]|nr:CRISPR-associated endonuclease Cas2 [Candidatus Desantisbacteria bacterium]